ncbi:hypothetical protein PENSPDRAFT_682052 [Peniophora sp. CONT]|nr:hypothetical protein PENSPDRAFT_682052 [Peniophora sp. CONT]
MSSDTVRTLPNGFEYVLVHFYSSGEAKANILPTIISFFELFATVGLLAAIVLSAIFTRNAKDSNLFVRTSLVFYFVSVLACEALSALSGVMTATWISDMQVFSGGLCTAQGFFRHFSDVGLAIWTVVITVQAFLILWRAQEYAEEEAVSHKLSVTLYGHTMPRIMFYKWFVLVTVWFSIGFIVMLGPAIGSSTNHGDFYGVFGESCNITAGYLPESIVFSSLIIIIAALTSIGLFVWMSYVIKPRSSELGPEVGFAEKDKAGKLSVEVARYMTWYPLVYFICVLPALIETIIFWSGAAIPVGYSVFVDTVYHLMGIVNASIFIFTPHPGPLLPHRPVSPQPPHEPRDLNAEAEKVKAQYAAAGVSLGGEHTDVPPPASSPPNDPKPPKRRPSRGREPPFPLRSLSPEPIQRFTIFRDAIKAHDEELGLAPVGPAEAPSATAHYPKSELEKTQNVFDVKQEDMHPAKEDIVRAEKKHQTRRSGAPSSVYSQTSPVPSSPLRIVVPARGSTRPGRDQPFPIVTLPSNPRPKGVEVRIEGSEKQPEVKVIVQPPPYNSPPSPRHESPPSPQTAPAAFDQTLVAAARDAPRSPSPSPGDVVVLAGSNSRFAKEQEKWMQRVVRESRSLVSRRTIPVPWLPQRPNGDPHSPDSFMDAEAAAIERSQSEPSNSNPDSPNLSHKRKVHFASQSSTPPPNEWYVGLLQAAGIGARVSRNGSKQSKTEPEPEVPHSAPLPRLPVTDVATAWRPYRDAFKAAGASTQATPAATSPQSATSDATLHSAEPMAAAWRPYTETATRAPEVKKDTTEVEAVTPPSPVPPAMVTDVGLTSSPESALDEEEIIVAKKAHRPNVPAQSVLLKAIRAESEQDLDAVLSKWGAKSAKKRDGPLPHVTSGGATPQGEEPMPEALASATGDYGIETAWACRQVPGEEGVWECEERIVDSYLDRSGSSLPRAGLTA